MNKISFYSATLLLATCSLGMFGQSIERRSVASSTVKEAPFIPAGYSHLKGVKTSSFDSRNLSAPILQSVSTAKARYGVVDRQMTPPARANASGNIKGYLGYHLSSYSMPNGWYNVKVPTSNLIWGQDGYYPHCGFVRDGKLTTWYSRSSTSEGLYEMGKKVFDVTTGALLSQETYSLFEQLDHLVWSCAYDEDADLVYLFSSRLNDANKYQSGVYDPKTDTYTRLGDCPDSDWPIAMNWSPEDGNVYILLEDGALKRLNKTTGAYTVACYTGHDISDYSGAMVYSPKDRGFVYLCSSYDNDSVTEMGVITLTGGHTLLGTMTYDEQWLIMYTDDPFAEGAAPAQATLEAWNFTGPALSGSMSLKMPIVTNNGDALPSSFFLEVTVDGNNVYDKAVSPAATVNIPLTLTEGLHTIIARPYVYSGINKVFALGLRLNKYAGHDIPATPGNVTLTKNGVSWTASGGVGANEGYVDASAVRYNVYINDQKMNSSPVSGTSYSCSMPGGSAIYVAEVEAVANGKTSARGVSNELASDGPLEIPFYLGPADGEQDMTEEMISMFTFVNSNNDNRTWQYDRQNPYTGGFYYLDHSENTADDWLLLPAANFPSASDVYKFSFEVWTGYHYFTRDERFEVGISPDKNVANMTIISPAQIVGKNENFTPVDVLFSVDNPGAKYIGIHCISDPDTYRLYARNFSVTRVQSTMSAPGAVTNLSVEPAADGRRVATVSFTMPTVDISGNELPSDTQVTATVTTPADSKQVTAVAGANASVEIGAEQGPNMFTVTTSSSSGEGASASIEATVGVDLPGLVTFNKSISADNKTMTLNWDLSTRGANGGPVIPSECTYVLMRYNGSAWLEYKDLGSATTYTYTHQGNAQEIVQFGVLAINGAGRGPSYATTGDVLGTPYGLPMHETFPYQGENVNTTYDPYMIEGLTELYPSWGFVDPRDLSDYGVTPNDSGISLMAYWIGQSRFSLPKFSTKGMHNVKLDFSAFYGAVTPSFQIFGRNADQDDILLGEFNQSSGDGWQNHTVNLPVSMQNRDWVSIYIVVDITSYSQYFLLDEYSISNYPGNDVVVSDVNGDINGNVGTTLNFNANVRNLGEDAVDMPTATARIMRGSEVLLTLDVTKPTGNLGAALDADYSFSFVPTAQMLGESILRFSIESDDANTDNNTADVRLNIHSANVPVPQNLRGVGTEVEANLEWDEPAIIFGAEENLDGEYGATIGRFRNLDRDGLVPYALTGINYPDRAEPKGFQVLPMDAISQLQPLIEGAGDRVLFTLASSKGVQDNWLISPEIVGNTEVSFRIACASTCDDEEYLTEHIELLASSTTDDPSAFTLVEEFSCSDVKWEDCSALLPADAKYFAIRYAGRELNFCLFVDNITYMPKAYDGDIAGYNVYKTGSEATMVAQRTWTDTAYDNQRPTAYEVRTLMTLGGANVESQPSKPLILMPQGVESAGLQRSQIVGGRGFIEVAGFAGKDMAVFTTDGRVVARKAAVADNAKVNVPAGIYIVVCGDTRAKVIVR